MIRSNELPYHVTGRVNNKESFPISLSDVWKIISTECLILQNLYDVQIQALVLMPNHFHMIITVTNEDYDLGFVMKQFMAEVTKAVHRKSGRSGRLFGDKYFWSIIQNPRYYGHVLKYVYRNPVRAHLCDKSEHYEFSTLRGLVGLSHLPLPIHLTRCGLEMNIPDPELRDLWLVWINTPFSKEAEILIQTLLRKKEIDLLIDRFKRKPNAILDQLI